MDGNCVAPREESDLGTLESRNGLYEAKFEALL